MVLKHCSQVYESGGACPSYARGTETCNVITRKLNAIMRCTLSAYIYIKNAIIVLKQIFIRGLIVGYREEYDISLSLVIHI